MKIIKYSLLIILYLILSSCKTENHEFPIEKRYWDLSDYDDAILELRYGYKDDESLPTFDNPENRIIVEKLTDHQNYKVVLDDKELGLKHRNEVASTFFNKWKDMNKIYSDTDRKDNYIYEEEMLKVWHFGLELQLKYFKLGNDQIKKNADDPNSSDVKNTIRSNINTMISNYLIYLDLINNEKSFTTNGKKILAEGIDSHFIMLVKRYPNANYKDLSKKIELMLKKTESDNIKTSLTKLNLLLAELKKNNKEK